MNIIITANGAGLDAPSSPIFGRCPVFVFVDTDTMAVESVNNPAAAAGGGAGIQAAQLIVEHGAQAVISGNVGPNAFNVLQAANLPVYTFNGGTVRQAVEAYKEGQLNAINKATSGPHHAGGAGHHR